MIPLKDADEYGHFHIFCDFRINAERLSIIDDELLIILCSFGVCLVSASDGQNSAVAGQVSIILADDRCAVLSEVIIA